MGCTSMKTEKGIDLLCKKTYHTTKRYLNETKGLTNKYKVQEGTNEEKGIKL